MSDGFTWFLVALSIVVVLGLAWMVLEATGWTPRSCRPDLPPEPPRPYDQEADRSA